MDLTYSKENWPLFLRRLGAYCIDNFLIYFASLIVFLILSFFITFSESTITTSSFMMFLVYYVFMYKKYGYTLGKKWLKIKVVNLDNSAMSYKTIFYRLFSSAVSMLILALGYVLILFNKEGFALHDKISKTKVVNI